MSSNCENTDKTDNLLKKNCVVKTNTLHVAKKANIYMKGTSIVRQTTCNWIKRMLNEEDSLSLCLILDKYDNLILQYEGRGDARRGSTCFLWKAESQKTEDNS